MWGRNECKIEWKRRKINRLKKEEKKIDGKAKENGKV